MRYEKIRTSMDRIVQEYTANILSQFTILSTLLSIVSKSLIFNLLLFTAQRI